MARPISLSYGSTAILHAIASGRQFGFDVMNATGLTSGSVYPALDRLESAGYLHSMRESGDVARAEGRPARRDFTLPGPGRIALHAALEEYRPLRPIPGLPSERA